MSLSAGTRLGAYEIGALLGAERDAATRPPDTMIIVLNWLEEFRRRVPN